MDTSLASSPKSEPNLGTDSLGLELRINPIRPGLADCRVKTKLRLEWRRHDRRPPQRAAIFCYNFPRLHRTNYHCQLQTRRRDYQWYGERHESFVTFRHENTKAH
ncbi:hypothetical protein J6590_017072 [Homalodisca vitripennis]|nr:hypothetical protein J6590_017072 [Homalodisca vitripennis]